MQDAAQLKQGASKGTLWSPTGVLRQPARQQEETQAQEILECHPTNLLTELSHMNNARINQLQTNH